MPLTGKQRHHLRALAHHLDPTVQIGKEGVTGPVIAQLNEALEAHELIKVRLGTECPMERGEVADAIVAGTRSDVAQAIGRVIVVYRRRAQKPKVELPTKGGAMKKKKPAGSKGKRIVRKKKRMTRSGRTRLR
jgi:RNA-binding protein